MKTGVAKVEQPMAVPEVLELLDREPEASLLAGGQSLIVELNMGRVKPGTLIDLNGVEGLDGVQFGPDQVTLGAMVRQEFIHRNRDVRAALPLLSVAAGWIGHPQVRARGTLGGSLAYAHPEAELPAAAIALDAVLHLEGPGGVRDASAKEFFSERAGCGLRQGELVKAITLPIQSPDSRVAVREVRRGHGAPSAVVGAMAVSSRRELRLVAFGVTAGPVDVAAQLDGDDPLTMREAVVEELMTLVRASAVRSDFRAPGDYRLRVLPQVLRAAIGDLSEQNNLPLFPRVGVTHE